MEREVSPGPSLRLKGQQAPGSLTEGVGTEKGCAGFRGSNQTLRNVSTRHPPPKKEEKIKSTI